MLRRFATTFVVSLISLTALAIVSCGIKGPLKLPPTKAAAPALPSGSLSAPSDASPSPALGVAPELPAPVSSPPSSAAPPVAPAPVPGDRKP